MAAGVAVERVPITRTHTARQASANAPPVAQARSAVPMAAGIAVVCALVAVRNV